MVYNLPPKFQAAVFFVSNVEKSKYFYNTILGQKITVDFGANVGFEGGLSIWKKNYALKTIFKDKAAQIMVGANNVEIYFESSNLEELLENLVKHEIRVIHPIMEHPWGQRAFRIYDPDKHIIEFGEPMESVVLRLHNEGLDLNAIVGKSLMPLEFIKNVLQSRKDS